MKHIGNEAFVTKEELKHEMTKYIVEDEDLKKDTILALIAGAVVLGFINFVFKEGEEE